MIMIIIVDTLSYTLHYTTVPLYCVYIYRNIYIGRSIIYLSLQVSNIVPHHICYITPNTASRHRLPPGTTKV